jgi:hypothetical protein
MSVVASAKAEVWVEAKKKLAEKDAAIARERAEKEAAIAEKEALEKLIAELKKSTNKKNNE